MIENIMVHKHIVFGFEHYNPLGIVRSLGEDGISPIGIIVKSERRITSQSKYLKTIHFVDSVDDGYKLLLDNYGKESNKPFVYASDDQIVSYMDMRYDDIKDKFYFYNAGSSGRINYYMDKYNVCKLAEKHGIKLAKTWVVPRGEIPADIIYPVVTKAIVSTLNNWKADSFVCNTEEELIQAFKNIRSDRVLLQQYIDKENELCIDGYVTNKGEQTIVTIATQYNYVIPNSYSYYMTIDNFSNKELYKKISSMFQEIGFSGIFSMEFLVGKNKELYFLEINFRNSTWSYASTRAGMALPQLWAKSVLNGKADQIEYCTIKKPFTAIVEFNDYRTRVKTKRIGKMKWFVEFCKCRVKYYCVWNDMMPVISIFKEKIKRHSYNGG